MHSWQRDQRRLRLGSRRVLSWLRKGKVVSVKRGMMMSAREAGAR